MLKPYDMLTKCQSKLKKCEIPTIDRLQVEMNILRAKINLLDADRETLSNCSVISETEIKDLYGQICNLCSSEGKVSDVKEIILSLQKFAEDIKKPLEVADKE